MDEEGTVRINKYIASHGICSRRKAEELIEAGRVLVDGVPAKLGQKVDPTRNRVKVGNQNIHPNTGAKPRTLLLNKPRGAVCTNDDPFAEKTVFQYLPKQLSNERFFVAGRLDKDSEGMTVLTQDGDLAHRLTHPSRGVVKRYHVLLSKPLDTRHIPVLLKGVRHEGELLRADKIIPAQRGPDADRRLEVHLHHGRKREIRRMFESLGYFVNRLKRVQIGALKLRGLGPGKVQELSDKDIELLFK